MTPEQILRDSVSGGVITLSLAFVALVMKYGPVIYRELVENEEHEARQ